MPFINRALKALKRIAIVIAIAVAFSVGLFGAIILSLRSSETTVPDIVGKDRTAAENAISAARLNFRVRATRPVADAKPDTVLIQIPNAGVVVKVGQTVAVDVSRATKEGEKSTSVTSETPEKKPENSNGNANASSNVSENKPKRPRNTNTNANANSNRGRSTNANRAGSANQNGGRSTNSSSNSTNRRPGANVNRTPSNSNVNRRVSRPATAPPP